MKKLFVLLAAVIFLVSGSVQAQNYFKFNSFDIEKGLVMTQGDQYTMAAFTIKSKKDSEVVVDFVLVNGNLTEVCEIHQWGNKTLYLVSIPSSAELVVGEEFDVEINLSYPGTQLKSAALGSTDDPGDGGPGNTTDPTVIVIKYP